MGTEAGKNLDIKGVVKTIGPGILYAGAAIGASHLILSTRAGASYSFSLIWLIILINLFKYPFFEYSYRYTAATGHSVLEGYRKLGNWAIITFLAMSFLTSLVNFAAVLKVTSDLAAFLFDIRTSSFNASLGLLILVLLMLVIGRYALLDKVMKAVVVVLAILTVAAFFFALGKGPQAEPGYVPDYLWNISGITFMIMLMGWMPTPIDASVWPSLWAMERKKQTGYTPSFKEYKVDFHLGYVGSAVLALFFLGLGALIMYGTGKQFSDNGVVFSEQLVSLYSQSIGKWSTSIIAIVVLTTMFSTTLTVIDGYPRSIAGSLVQLFPSLEKKDRKLYLFWVLFLSVAAVVIIRYFTKDMVTLLQFATVISFLTAPIFAIINFKIVTSKSFPEDVKPGKWLRILSWAGIIFLVGFSVVYLVYVLF